MTAGPPATNSVPDLGVFRTDAPRTSPAFLRASSAIELSLDEVGGLLPE